MSKKLDYPNFKDVLRARHDLKDLVKKTPLMTVIWLKKHRLGSCGSSVKISKTLDPLNSEEPRMHYAGYLKKALYMRLLPTLRNHGSALASAARTKGIHAHIVVPQNAPHIKKTAISS